ncbi:endonuclease VII domain-containing protein [Actinoplanes sp. NPDC051494]|uniref:endonuclease VII domain-containing protein n=1 Tax=Actinoplanes sp. NPDC051494 TaxID=3363907 RepID=UPI0037AF520A
MDDEPEGSAFNCKQCAAERSTVSRRKRGTGEQRRSPVPGLRQRYGIGQRDFDEMLARQGGMCAICGADDPQHVDHDHRTGWVRGILCFNCNGGLGRFRDDPVFLAGAIAYLKGTTWQRVLIHPGVFQMCSPTRGHPPSRSS